MARVSNFPTYEFANDPLPPRPATRRAPADREPAAFRPVATVRLGDARVKVTTRVDGGTPWRETGNTDFDHFREAIGRTADGRGTSPLVAEARQLYDVLSRAGLSRFAVGILWHEKKNDTWVDTPIPPWMHNPFSTRDRQRPGHWEQFDSYEAAAIAWVERIGKEPYPQQGSIRDFVEIYAPSFENDVARYVAVIAEQINALPMDGAQPAPPKGRPVSIAGLQTPIFLPHDIRFEAVLTPIGGNRPGHPMPPQGVTQHETGNQGKGTGAWMHSQWQDAGTPGHPNGKVGVHFYVDDQWIIQKIPVNEVSIHALSPANETHISVELCVNSDRDKARAERNAMMLDAALLRDGLHRGVEALKCHNDWWPGNPCPAVLNGERRWLEFKRGVERLIQEGGEGLKPTFPGLPESMPVEVLLALFPDANPNGPVTKFYIDYCVQHMPPGQWPRFNGHKDLSDGTRWWDFNPLHLFSDATGKVWVAARDEVPAARGSTAGPAAGDVPADGTLTISPSRDYREKEQAAARDRGRRQVTTTAETGLLETPRGQVLRRLAAGTRLTVLGEAERGFLPVVLRGDDPLRGYVERDAVAPVGPGKENGGGHGGAGSGTVGDRIASEATRYVGYPYVWATHGPGSFDCSGLVHWVVMQATGDAITVDSHPQFNLGTAVDRGQLQPGDLLFYDTMGGTEVREGNPASHVGIYVGRDRMVNALNEERGVIESDPFSDYFAPLFIGARRLF